MSVAICSDSNSGITRGEAQRLGVSIIPMPFYVGGTMLYEGIDLSQEEFFELLSENIVISTSSPTVGEVSEVWDSLLKTHDEVVHIPMSSGLSGACETARMIAGEYGGRVHVVDNQRISATQRQSVLDAVALAGQGRSGAEIRAILERDKFESSIYIMVDTLYYLKKGGRVTPAAAAVGSLLKIKPVLQIQGEKLDAFSKARSPRQARAQMISAIKKDLAARFKDPGGGHFHIEIAYTKDRETAEDFRREALAAFPGRDIYMAPLSLSVACHIGPGAIGIACTRKTPELEEAGGAEESAEAGEPGPSGEAGDAGAAQGVIAP